MSGATVAPAARGAALDAILGERRAFGDRVLRIALLVHFGIALALAPCFDTWAITLPVASAGLAMFLVAAWAMPRAFATRCIAGVALQVFCALHIYQLHGLPEMHFFFFTGFTLMIVYGDWRAMWPGTLLIIAQHIVFAVLTNSGVDVRFFPETYVGATKLFWHFSLACVHVAICGVFAHLLQRTIILEHERRRHIAELAEYAERASRHKSEFLATMSHEIRTPIAGMLGHAELLLEADASDALRNDAARRILRNGQHLLAVVNDVLDLAKVEAGRLEVTSEPCSPEELVRDAVELFRPRAAQKRLRLELVTKAPLPQRIRSDSARLRQIVANLVGNAIKFTAEGSVRVEMDCTTVADQPGARLRIAVVDTGPGLTPDQLARIFWPFVQGDPTVERRHGGTGLGLAISRRLAVLLGGELVAEEQPPGVAGARFVLTLPLGEPIGEGGGDAGGEPSDAAVPREDLATHAARALLGVRVLVADDGEDNRLVLAHHLRRAGARVDCAVDGRRAVERAAAACDEGEPYALVVMDMQMPELDGYAATRALRVAGHACRVVAVTASAMSDDRARCLAAGCDEYLTKPVRRQLLIATCARLVAGGEDGRGAALRVRSAVP
ncbi:MAG: response regulator [Planctomycetes bacterium]|nr:response regulator [Planctomycetota bacterium]